MLRTIAKAPPIKAPSPSLGYNYSTRAPTYMNYHPSHCLLGVSMSTTNPAFPPYRLPLILSIFICLATEVSNETWEGEAVSDFVVGF
jgi:hypothetical protein